MKEAVPVVLMIRLIDVCHSLLPSFNLPFFVFCLFMLSFVFFLFLLSSFISFCFCSVFFLSILHLLFIHKNYFSHLYINSHLYLWSISFTSSSSFLSFPLSLFPSSGLWVRAAPTPTCWMCRVAPTRSEYVAAHFSTPRSCMKMLRWPERWSSTCPTWRWRRMKRNTKSCPCSVNRHTAPVSNNDWDHFTFSSEPFICLHFELLLI